MEFILRSFSSSGFDVSYKRNYAHEVLVKRLFKLIEVRLTDCLDMTIAVDWDVTPQTKQIHKTLED